VSLESRVVAAPAARWLSVVYVIAGSLVIAASARIATPFMTVPTTLQTYALLVLAAVFGPRHAAAMAIVYLGEGLVGLPVFAAGSAGPLVLAGPTGGYLLAFPGAALLVGSLHAAATRRLGLAGSFALMILAHVVIITSGVGWLAPRLGLTGAFFVGAVPFFLGTLVKSALAAVTVRLVRR